MNERAAFTFICEGHKACVFLSGSEPFVTWAGIGVSESALRNGLLNAYKLAKSRYEAAKLARA